MIKKMFDFFAAYAQAPIDPEVANFRSLETIFANFLNVATTVGALLAFISLIIGGFKYMIARGDPKQMDAARSTVTWSIFGLIALFAAYLVIRLIAQFTGVGITTFQIPGN